MTTRATMIVATLMALAGYLLVVVAAAQPAVATTQPAHVGASPDLGPDVIVLKELSEAEGLYDPVPFDHKAHAHMAETQKGCVTCHHQSPDAEAIKANGDGHANGKSQKEASQHPACKTCHDVKRNDIRVPGLKGAYHQQCLNCHKEWTGENKCVACHAPRGTTHKEPTVQEVLGRMHEPVQMPDIKLFQAHFKPADGGNILFRHKQHVEKFGLRCVTCHQEADSCARCHEPEAERKKRETARKVGLDRSWEEVHKQCSSCHQREQKRCNHCHYKDDQSPPAPFEHASTGQLLDEAHAGMKCADCHGSRTDRVIAHVPVKQTPTCGGASCHAKEPAIAFPQHKPGPVVPVKPEPEKKSPRASSTARAAAASPAAAGGS